MISANSINAELDTIISGSDDGTILVYSLREGCYIRCIDLKGCPGDAGAPAANPPSARNTFYIGWMGISKEAIITAYVCELQTLYSFSINGQHLASVFVDDHLQAFCFSEDGSVILTGGRRCLVVLRWARNLELAASGIKAGLTAVLDGSGKDAAEDEVIQSPIRCLCFSKEEQHLIAGLDSGYIKVFTQTPCYLQERKKKLVKQLGFV